jgi:hypothetical protein
MATPGMDSFFRSLLSASILLSHCVYGEKTERHAAGSSRGV